MVFTQDLSEIVKKFPLIVGGVVFIFTTRGLNLRSLVVIFEAHYIADVFFYWWNQGIFSFFNSFCFVLFF